MRHLFLMLALSAPLASLADSLQIPLGEQGETSIPVPVRGEPAHSVLEHFGPPTRRHSEVGNPPISRWDYENFSVYFESGRVIHNVRHQQPDTPSRKE